MKCLLVADDLTGACDAAVAFAAHGYRATVLLELDRFEAHDGVMAVSTDSRNAPGCDFACIAGAFRGTQPAIVFKKIDSTLRGNIGPEVVAAMQAFGCEAAAIAPAFPALGRIVESGRLRAMGLEDFEPIDVAEYFRPHGLAPYLAGDVLSDRDLDSFVASRLAAGGRILWVGSGGLAAALARAVARPRGATPRARPPSRPRGAVLFAVGSGHPVTLEQLRRLLAARPGSAVLRVPCESLKETLAAAGSRIAALFLSGGDTAAAVCGLLGARAIELEDEIDPGVPRGRLVGGLYDGVPVVTKSGAFGPPDALIRIAEYFTCH